MKQFVLILVLAVGGGALADVTRGGFGFLFPDPNSSRNPGSLVGRRAFDAQVLWAKFSGTHEQSLVSSVALAARGYSVSAYGSRYGMSLTDSAQSEDVFGAGAAVALLGGRLALGLRVDRAHDVHRTIARGRSEATYGGTVTYRGEALAAGVGVTDRDLTLALGAPLGDRVRIEWVTLYEPGPGVWETGAFAGWQGERFFAAGGLAYLDAIGSAQILLRVGVGLGPFDLSAFFTQVMKDGENPFHGGALRLAL